MNHIDELMLNLLNNQSKSTLEILKEKNEELKNLAFKNYHWELLKRWMIGLGFVGVGVIVGIVVFALTPQNLLIAALSSSSSFSVGDLTKSLIAPSLTMNGLFVTLLPVIGFFFLTEVKDWEKESRENTERLTQNIGKKEDSKKEVAKRAKYEHAFFTNIRCGILSYMRSYVTIGLGSLLFLLFAYVLLNSALFLLTVVLVPVILLTGIFPIISIALNKPALTLVTIPLENGEQEILL